jgi:DNA-binding HxlR family transcriptional regulator
MPSPNRPTAELLDLLGRRWALRVLWELRAEPVGFGDLQARCDGMSTSVLSQRLGELREAGLVEHRARGGYALTDPGAKLLARLKFFDDWASEWAEQWSRATRVSSGPGNQGERHDRT